MSMMSMYIWLLIYYTDIDTGVFVTLSVAKKRKMKGKEEQRERDT